MGMIFNIQHFSVHDGPGIRTVVFLKGCPLRCMWCANPESQNGGKELAWSGSICLSCQSCVHAGTGGTYSFQKDGLHWKMDKEPNWEKLRVICPSKALHVIGEEKSVEEIINLVERDAAFYDNSGGGLTLGGGEPLAQPDFAQVLLEEAKYRGIHCAMETSGYAEWEDFYRAAEQLDYLLFDIKALDDEVHKKYTGVSNRMILDNLRQVRERLPKLPIHVRTPVIPGVNDKEEAIQEISAFLSRFSNIRYELLRYHRLGEPKYISLHRPYPMGNVELSAKQFENLRKYEFYKEG